MGEFNFGGEIQRIAEEHDSKMKRTREEAAGRAGGVGQARPERREMPAFTPEAMAAAQQADESAGRAGGVGQLRPERRTMGAVTEQTLEQMLEADKSAGRAAGVGRTTPREMPRIEL